METSVDGGCALVTPESEFAVLVPILERNGEPCVLFTKRPESLRQYSGQVSFPGGRREPGETLLETALRETEEEVGIPPRAVNDVRVLGWHETGLGHRVKPFVGAIADGVEIRPAPAEVERTLYLPLSQITPGLFRERTKWIESSAGRISFPSFLVDGEEVWGLTARVLHSAFVVRA